MNYKNFISIILWPILLSCNQVNSTKNINECGFSYKNLKPMPDCMNGLNVDATNKHQHLQYWFNNKLVKEDSIIYFEKTRFLFSNESLQLNKYLRLSTSIVDTSRTFIFKHTEDGYKIAFIESYFGDSSIRIQFPYLPKISFSVLTNTTLDSLKKFDKYETLLNESLIVNYYYLNKMLYYKVIEDYVNWKGEDLRFDSIKYNYGNIYLDIESIEDKRIIFYWKQTDK